jgi:adenylate cyclase
MIVRYGFGVQRSSMQAGVLSEDDLNNEKDRLNSLYSYGILDTDPEEAYNRIVEVASCICGTPVSLITLIDADRQWFKAKKGTEVAETPREISFCNHAIQGNGVMEVPDALEDSRFQANPLVTSGPNIRFYAGSPLITPEGYKLGTLCVIDDKPHTLSEQQKKCLEVLAGQVVAQMELQRQVRELENINTQLLDELKVKLEEKNQVLQLFTRFVPDEVVSKHLQTSAEVADDAESKYLVVMFCDIRGYTSMVENKTPGIAMEILRRYYSIMSDVIRKYSGMVNQYVGDEIFATFGAPFAFPPYERNAVFCALEMLEKLTELNKKCRGLENCEIKVGIGIHAGEVITGTMGSKDKIEYSVIGDAVNTGKRIESLTQNRPNTILISETVYDSVKEYTEVNEWPAIPVKGKTDPVKIYEVVGRK